jgi:hypothetical protein
MLSIGEEAVCVGATPDEISERGAVELTIVKSSDVANVLESVFVVTAIW